MDGEPWHGSWNPWKNEGDDDDQERPTKPSRLPPDRPAQRPKIGRQTNSSPSGAGAGLMPSARLGPLFFLLSLASNPPLSIESASASAWARRPTSPFASDI